MEFEIKSGVCKNCDMNKCERHCIIHTGKALYDYIAGIDTVETKIGEYSHMYNKSNKELIYSGYKVFELSEPIHILSPIDTEIIVSSKFANVHDYTAFQLLKEYINYANIDKEEADYVVNKLSKLNKNKLLIIPIKPHSECRLNEDIDDVTLDKTGKVHYIDWNTNKETHKLECTVAIKFGGKIADKIYKYNISDYNDKFRISSLDVKMIGSKTKNKFIKMNEYGMIHPIEVACNDFSIIIDGTYLYCKYMNRSTIIGQWGPNNSIEKKDGNTELFKSKVFDQIRKNMDYITSHLKYIAPYGIIETNKIIVK